MMGELALRFAVGVVAGLLVIPLVKILAVRIGCVAAPKADRWHRRSTPLLGGLAIAAVVLVGGLTVSPLQHVGLILACGAIVAAVGLIDDLISLKSSSKLIAEIMLASALVYSGHRLHWTGSLTLDVLVTLVWIVGITNALNLLDNMDGLCAGVGLIAGTALLVALVSNGAVPPEAHLLALLLGALTAFLVFNFHPASVFMGDTGSLFVGLMLSAVATGSASVDRNRADILSIVAAPVLVLLIPIFDTTLVTVSRVLSGRRPSQGGRDHSSHRLVALGLSERRAVGVLWILAGVGGLIGIAVRQFSADWTGLIAGVFVLAMVIFAVYLADVRVYDRPPQSSPRDYTPMLVDFMYKRRFAEVLLDFCLVAIAYYAAYRLRFEGPDFVSFFPQFIRSLPVVIGIQLAALFAVGTYRATWRYFGLMDAVVLAKGTVGGTIAVVVVLLYVDRFANYSRSAFIIYGALLMLLLTGSRASFRLMGEFVARRAAGPRVVVYSGGIGQQLVVRGVMATLSSPSRLLGFIYDAPERTSGSIQGYPVLGGYPELLTLISAGSTDEVLVCVPDLEEGRLEELKQHCASCRVKLSQLRYNLELLSEQRSRTPNAAP
jgi:UDP-GlcNAc:undecaprenyl-phosphate GlcNAc-1-phosphate transferase